MRYKKQNLFSKIGAESQRLLEKSAVVIVGIGALGTIVLDMLARAGVGKIKIIDRDIIEIDNLQRQTLFDESDVGKAKAEIAAAKIKKINSEVVIEYNIADLDYNNVELLESDLILDCTDNMYTRFIINDYSRKKGIPWIYASVVGSRGFIMNINRDTPCIRCIFKEPTGRLETCSTSGILNTIPHIIGAIQATEALKILTKQDYSKELIYYDIWENKLNKIKVKKLDSCRPCNKIYDYLSGKKIDEIKKICSSKSFQIKLNSKDIERLFSNINNENLIKQTEQCLILKEAILFKSGRALIKAETEEQAKEVIAKYMS